MLTRLQSKRTPVAWTSSRTVNARIERPKAMLRTPTTGTNGFVESVDGLVDVVDGDGSDSDSDRRDLN